MAIPSEARLSGRERKKLCEARANGYLNARSSGNRPLVQAFSLWCWLLRIPTVWVERRSPRSRYFRVRLEMFTTNQMLTSEGQAALRALGAARASPHDAWFERIAQADAARLSKAVYRAATRAGNYQSNRSERIVDMRRDRSGKLLAVA